MKEISVILPVYNSEKYIEKCMNSIVSQLDDIYELIVINDESTDKTMKIIKELQSKYTNIKIYNIKHQGISTARNYGISKVKSKYFIFIDSDDYIVEDLIKELSIYLNKNYDLIRYQAQMVNDQSVEKIFATNFYGEYQGLEFLKCLCRNNEIFGPPWFYCYNTDFIRKNNFRYADGKVQEDFGLTPLMICKANKILSINYIGYNYYKSCNSIMRNDDYNKTVNKFFDVLYHYDFLLSEFKQMKIAEPSIYLYLEQVLFAKYEKLTVDDQRKYQELLDERGICNHENK